MALLDLLGRRWLARIIWELNAGPQTFRSLRTRCDDVSPTVLNQRLSELREVGLVKIAPDGGYALSDSGRGLLYAMRPLMAWSQDWEQDLRRAQASEDALPYSAPGPR